MVRSNAPVQRTSAPVNQRSNVPVLQRTDATMGLGTKCNCEAFLWMFFNQVFFNALTSPQEMLSFSFQCQDNSIPRKISVNLLYGALLNIITVLPFPLSFR